MKKMRGMALLMSVAVAAGVMQGCGKKEEEKKILEDVNFPLAETVTYDVVMQRYNISKPYTEYEEWNKYFEDKSNVKINWVDWGTDDTYTQKLSLAFASDDLPDAVYGAFCIGMDGLARYGEAGLIIPLEDMIPKYMPNLMQIAEKNPEVLEDMRTPDGHIYGIPSYDPNGLDNTQESILYNREWLEKLNMEVPTTTDEFYNYLKAIKDAGDLNGNGKKDEIPFTFRLGTAGARDHQYGLCSFIGFTGKTFPQNSYIVENGKTIFAASTEEYKEAIKYLNKLYSEGLIDKEAFTMDATAYTGRIKNSEKNVGVCIAPNAGTVNGVLGDDAFVYGPPLKHKEGVEPSWFRRVTPANFRTTFFITNKAENPEVLLKWLDMHFERDISLQNSKGKMDMAFRKVDDVQIENLKKDDGTDYTGEEKAAVWPSGAAFCFATGDYEIVNKPEATIKHEEAVKTYYEPYLMDKEEVFYQNVYTSEEGEIRNRTIGEVEPYVIETMAKWITKGGVDEEWDDYLKQLDILGVQDWTGVMQAAYDRTVQK